MRGIIDHWVWWDVITNLTDTRVGKYWDLWAIRWSAKAPKIVMHPHMSRTISNYRREVVERERGSNGEDFNVGQ